MKSSIDFYFTGRKVWMSGLVLLITLSSRATIHVPQTKFATIPAYTNAIGDTAKKDTTSKFEKFLPTINKGKVPFYGVWADYFSSYMKINADSTFEYSWGYALQGSWTAGKWYRMKDTFFFRAIPVYDTLRYSDENNVFHDTLILAHYLKPRMIYKKRAEDDLWLSVQNAHPTPEKLCFYPYKLYLLDSSGNLMIEKIPSPYMGKKNRKFKTFYFRDKRFNLDYFNPVYYEKASAQKFKFGTGMNVMLQPVSGYRVVGSVGFTVSPRYIFDRRENSYLSLGMPFTLGFSRLDVPGKTDLTLGIMLDIPLVINYNYSFGSVEHGGSRLEYFYGGGFAYHYNHYTAARDYETTTQQINGFGPMMNAGLRYDIGRYRLRSLELRFSYMKMLESTKSDILGIGWIVNF